MPLASNTLGMATLVRATQGSGGVWVGAETQPLLPCLGVCLPQLGGGHISTPIPPKMVLSHISINCPPPKFLMEMSKVDKALHEIET